jgi:RNA polymerase sigma-70 factor (ECF subfamily)
MSNKMESGFTDAELLETIPALRSFARRFHPYGNEVDDLVQETLSRALANADKFQKGTRLRSWLFTIMRNYFCTKYSVSKREHVGLVEDSSTCVFTPADQEWRLRGRELERALSALPDHYRAALTMIFVEGTSYEIAAKRCGCPVGTLKSRVNRARSHLGRVLQHGA